MEPSEYIFLIGPEPYSVNGEERRKLVTIPARYIETKRTDNPIRLGQFTFAIDFPAGNPVSHDKLGYQDVLIVSVISAPVGSVKRRVDGSWLNHFSGYPVKKGNQYNLNIFGRTEWFQRSLLYVSDDMNTIIECEQIVDNKAMNCVMMNGMFENVVVQISFDPSLLPQWQKMLSLAKKLIGQPKPYREK